MRQHWSTREDGVQSRHYKHFFVCLSVILLSALLAQAQSGDNKISDSASPAQAGQPQPILLARAAGIPPAAADSSLPDAPSASHPDAAASSDPAPPPSAPVRHSSGSGAPPAARGGPFGVDRTVADWRYWTVTGAMFSASVFDAEETQKCLKQKTCAFLPDFLYSRAAMYGIGIPADLAISYWTFHLKKKNSRIWYVPSALVTAANFYVGIHSYGRAH